MEYSKSKLSALVLLRLVIGWHFFYEGMVKVLNPSWTSKAYLLDSGGFAKPFFEWIARNDILLAANDLMNAWVLTIAGLFLLLGVLVRPAALAGMFLLAMYYLSHPAFPGLEYLFPTDGSYFIINKTLIELVAMCVIFAFPTAHIIGLERLFYRSGNNP
ncbi:MAG: DoxX family membrane protein [Bacteroidales bacterium]|nr:DoxX family membrane protein [Bacteroidales bacterium]MDZ4204898.1 DoxX family membrane protein [Bacteroidales bacterium]